MRSGGCTSGSIAHRTGATSRTFGFAAETSTRTSRSSSHHDDLREALGLEWAPSVALVCAREEAPVAKRRDEAVLGAGERVRHRVERSWNTEVELFPRA